MKNDSQGSLIISVLLIAAIMVLGYVVISNILTTKEAQTIQNTAEETVERVNDAREQVEATRNAAESAIQSTTDLIDQVSP